MNKKLKDIPKFADEAEEREFWLTHDTTDYVDWSKAKRVSFPNLKPTTQSISLRLPLWMLESIKTTANRQDVPYQSLIKAWLAEKLDEQRKAGKGKLYGKQDVSELAGSYEQLSDYAITMCPTDLEGSVRALHEAHARCRHRALEHLRVGEREVLVAPPADAATVTVPDFRHLILAAAL